MTTVSNPSLPNLDMGKSALSFNWLKITFSHGDWQAHFQCHSLDTFFFYSGSRLRNHLFLLLPLQVNSDTFGQGYKTLHTTLPSLNEVEFAEQKDTWREAVKPSQLFIKGCWKKLPHGARNLTLFRSHPRGAGDEGQRPNWTKSWVSHLTPASSDFIKGVIWTFKNKGRNDQSFDLTHTFPRSPLLQPLLRNK